MPVPDASLLVPSPVVAVSSPEWTAIVSIVPGVVSSLGGSAPAGVDGPEGVEVSPVEGFWVAGGAAGGAGAWAGAAGGAGAGAGSATGAAGGGVTGAGTGAGVGS